MQENVLKFRNVITVKLVLRYFLKPGVVAYTFDSSTLGGKGRQIFEFMVSLIYKVGSRQPGLHKETPS